MDRREIQRRFECALRSFYKQETLLVEYQVSERALTHKLAEHLQKLFPRHDVDCEYNRVGHGDPKILELLMAGNPDCPKDCSRCPANKCVVFPDIIVHHRGKDKNLLVIEAKTAWSKESQSRDFKKLKALTASAEYHYHYELGIAFCFSKNISETLKTVQFIFDQNL